MEEQWEVKARCWPHKGNLLDSASVTSYNLRERFWKLKTKHDQELADIRFEHDSLQAQLVTNDNRG